MHKNVRFGFVCILWNGDSDSMVLVRDLLKICAMMWLLVAVVKQFVVHFQVKMSHVILEKYKEFTQ